MFLNSFYVFDPQCNLNPCIEEKYRGRLLPLLAGDEKNDKIKRIIQKIVVSSDEKHLVETLLCDAACDNSIVVYIVGFTHRYAETLRQAKAQRSLHLNAVNGLRGRRHPASIVAIADRVLRVKN